MSSLNESAIQVWHKYQNIVKPFLLSGGTYKYQKTTKKLAKALKRFLRILLQLCCSRFRLIISEKKLRCKFQDTGVEKKLFRAQSDIQAKYGGV